MGIYHMPTEIIEIIVSYLDFIDLLYVRTCSKIFHVFDHRLTLVDKFKNLDVNNGLILAAEIGELSLFNHYLKKGATEIDDSLRKAMKNGHTRVVDKIFLTNNSKKFRKNAFVITCRYGSRDLIIRLEPEKMRSYYWRDAVAALVRRGQSEYLDLILKYYDKLLACYGDEETDSDVEDMGKDYILEKICKGANILIYKTMEAKLKADPHHALIGAIASGKIEMIEEIKYNAPNFGLAKASEKVNIDLMDYFINKGANDYKWALKSAIYKNQLQSSIYLANRITDHDLIQTAIDFALQLGEREQIIDYLNTLIVR